MWHMLMRPWRWSVGGPLIGLIVPLLLLLGNKQLGVSASLRAICAAAIPGPVAFFRYDWKQSGSWNVALALGLFAGGVIAITVLGASTPNIAPATRTAIATLGLGPGARPRARGAVQLALAGHPSRRHLVCWAADSSSDSPLAS